MTPTPPKTLPPIPPLHQLVRAWLSAPDTPPTAHSITEVVWEHWATVWGGFDSELDEETDPATGEVKATVVRIDLLGGASVARHTDPTTGEELWVALLEDVPMDGGPRQTRIAWTLRTQRDVVAWMMLLKVYCHVYHHAYPDAYPCNAPAPSVGLRG